MYPKKIAPSARKLYDSHLYPPNIDIITHDSKSPPQAENFGKLTMIPAISLWFLTITSIIYHQNIYIAGSPPIYICTLWLWGTYNMYICHYSMYICFYVYMSLFFEKTYICFFSMYICTLKKIAPSARVLFYQYTLKIVEYWSATIFLVSFWSASTFLVCFWSVTDKYLCAPQARKTFFG